MFSTNVITYISIIKTGLASATSEFLAGVEGNLRILLMCDFSVY